MNYSYCERTDSAFWSEPLNAVSNLSFFLIAVILYFKFKNNKNNTALYLLTIIGFSSFLYHTVSNIYFAIIDSIAIITFVFYYLYCIHHKIFNFSRMYSLLLCTIVILIYIPILYFLKESIIGSSIVYMPMLINIILYAFISYIFNKRKPNLLVYASILFIISLAFRTLDYKICAVLKSYGTHFVWHILNSITIYFLIKFLYINERNHPKNTNLDQ